jgi:RNA polymerase sigma-70 factor, ECF subfamily
VSRGTSLQDSDDLASCVVAAQGGDEAAFDTLYVTVQPGLLRYLRALVGADAEDVASQTWLQIVRDLPALRDASGFRAWATAIARHRALDHLRHHRRRPAIPTPIEELLQVSAEYPDAEEEAAEAVTTDAALALIASLPRDEAEAVLLRVVVGLDTIATAAVLGKRPGAVRVAAHRGLRRLAARLSREPESSSRSLVTLAGHPAPEKVR